MEFNIAKAPEEQKSAIYAVTELLDGIATRWERGPFGQAYMEYRDSAYNAAYYVVHPNGKLEIRYPVT